jgi:hypothetical protein
LAIIVSVEFVVGDLPIVEIVLVLVIGIVVFVVEVVVRFR